MSDSGDQGQQGQPGQWPPPSGQPPGQWPPPSGQPPPQPGYPAGYQPPPQYGYAPRTEGTAVGALVSAILSFVVCPVIPAIVALVLASTAKRNIAASGGALEGQGLVTAATVISWVNIGLSALVVVAIVLIAVLGDSNSSSFNDSMGLLLSR
jgi:uncharacterized protein DUF4190